MPGGTLSVRHSSTAVNGFALALCAANGLESPQPQSCGAFRGLAMKLSAPTIPIFLISVILAVAAALVVYGGVRIPLVSGHAFITLGIAYLVLLAGNLFRGL